MRRLAFAMCPVIAASAVWAQDIPDRSITNIGPHLPVSSLRELWEKTPVVVLATVQDTLPPQIERETVVFRYQILDVQEVLKRDGGSILSGRRIRVKVYGGTVRVGGRKFITNYLAHPIPEGEEAILFLSPLPAEDAFGVPYGETGTFPVDQLTDQVLIKSYAVQRMPEFTGRDRVRTREFMAVLRKLGAPR